MLLNGPIDVILFCLAGVLLVPLLVFCIECTLSFPPRLRRPTPTDTDRPRVAVLIPAHDEASVIHETLRSILPQLRGGDRIVVVADNCTDSTAGIAEAAGCEVVRRVDRNRRGKGFALDAGLRHLAETGTPPQVVIMFDADSTAQDHAVTSLAVTARRTGRPVQGTYLMELPAAFQPHTAVSALAVMVKNFVRPRGLSRLHLPCLLTGTGMAFPWDVVRGADLATGNIVEDMQLGIDLALAGKPPVFCEEARVIGRLPSGTRAAQTQRRRWEHGHLRTLLQQAPRLALAALRTGRLSNLALLLELCVPPLSLLVMFTTLSAGVAAVAVPLLDVSPVPAMLLGGGLLWLGLCVTASWVRFGRRMMPFASVMAAPGYALAKVPLYTTFVRRRETEWVRTDRGPAPHVPTPNPARLT